MFNQALKIIFGSNLIRKMDKESFI